MATFTINPNTTAWHELEAKHFQLRDGYWHFFDDADKTVYVISANAVGVIERKAE